MAGLIREQDGGKTVLVVVCFLAGVLILAGRARRYRWGTDVGFRGAAGARASRRGSGDGMGAAILARSRCAR